MLSFITYSPDIKVESKDLEVRLMKRLRSKIGESCWRHRKLQKRGAHSERMYRTPLLREQEN